MDAESVVGAARIAVKICLCAGLAFVVVAVGACAQGPAASIGLTQITRDDLARELAAVVANRAYIRHYSKASRVKAVDGDGRPTKLLTAVTLTNAISYRGIDQLADQEDVRVTSRDRQAGRRDASTVLGGEKLLRAFAPWYRAELERRAATANAVRRSFLEQTTTKQFYERNRAEFVRSCARNLLVKTKREANAARERILNGESFASVAREVSIDRGTGPRGGFLGCNERGDLLLELDEAAFSLPVGKVSKVIEIETGFNLLLVEKRSTPPLREIRGQIESAIGRWASQEVRSRTRVRLQQLGVRVSRDYGRWDPARLVVVPA